MEKSIKTILKGARDPENITYDLSDQCPHCKVSVTPDIIYAITSKKYEYSQSNYAAILVQCPSNNCSQFYIDYFYLPATQSNISKKTSRKEKYFYKPLLSNDLPNEVNEKFPEFNEIYSQAIQAENYGLNQIAGVGYRKALEFLVKQYCIHKNSENEETIKKEALGSTIANRLSDFPKIQLLAKAATWIGNDETHFVRKHKDHDIASMKKFIKSAATFISADLDADEAIEFTNKD